MDQSRALQRLNAWGGEPLPVSASAWWDNTLVVRLAGARAAVEAATSKLGGEGIEAALAGSFWQGLRDQRDEFFAGAQRAVEAGATLWRLGLPQTAEPITLAGEQLVEWGGAQRWLCTSIPAAAVREAASAAGGHATLFRSRDKTVDAFHPLSAPLARFHRELKRAFDPDGVFNPGRLYLEL
jgi:glycolate oxidase FAD binding subunit